MARQSHPVTTVHALGAVATVLALASTPAIDEEHTESRWYGWQTLTVDALATGVILASKTAPALIAPGFITYVVGPPVVHGCHGRNGALGISLGMRVVAPLAGLMIGRATARPNGEDEAFDAQFRGLVLGYFAAVAFDAFALSWERIPAPKTPPPTIQPTVDFSRNGASVGFGGVF